MGLLKGVNDTIQPSTAGTGNQPNTQRGNTTELPKKPSIRIDKLHEMFDYPLMKPLRVFSNNA